MITPAASMERTVTHVYKIEDTVIDSVREFILLYGRFAPLDIQLDLSEFLSRTKVPYRAKSKSYQIWKK